MREGGSAELVCMVDGKPRPPVLWSRADKDLAMPSGEWAVETRDGRLRLTNVSRDMTGAYRCQTAPYNGLNIKRREAQVQLNVQCESLCSPASGSFSFYITFTFIHLANAFIQRESFTKVHRSLIITSRKHCG